jgi:hypothetical protein
VTQFDAGAAGNRSKLNIVNATRNEKDMSARSFSSHQLSTDYVRICNQGCHYKHSTFTKRVWGRFPASKGQRGLKMHTFGSFWTTFFLSQVQKWVPPHPFALDFPKCPALCPPPPKVADPPKVAAYCELRIYRSLNRIYRALNRIHRSLYHAYSVECLSCIFGRLKLPVLCDSKSVKSCNINMNSSWALC